MATAAELGMSQSEFEEAMNLEKLYFMVNKHDRCAGCSRGGVTHVDCSRHEFLCHSCANGKSNCKKIGDDRFKAFEIQKLERKYGDGKGSSSHSAPSRRRSSPPAVRASARDKQSKSRHKSKPRKRTPSPSSDSDVSTDYEEPITVKTKSKGRSASVQGATSGGGMAGGMGMNRMGHMQQPGGGGMGGGMSNPFGV
eukprot:GHVQ01029030.1.p1 GENE.GHVQ01029030.1~~GHVQ01029030.1.p1  ORF type:complete len:196 (-),score=40.11 GHVQ01029030.1:300-887(-)